MILLILKILGILLASMIGLLFFFVLMILLIPIRYRGHIERDQEFKIKTRLTWLGHVIFFHLAFDKENKAQYELRIFGFVFLSSDSEWKKKQEQKKEQKKQKQKAKKEKKRKKRKEKAKKKRAKKRIKAQKTKKIKPKNSTTKEPSKKLLPTKDSFIKETSELSTDNSTKRIEQGLPPSEDRLHDQTKNDTKARKKGKLSIVLFTLRKKLYQIKRKIKNIFQKIKEKIASLFHNLKQKKEKAALVLSFLKEETNKKAFSYCFRGLMKMLKHVAPQKIRGYFAYGFEDPSTTGYVLAFLGMVYSKIGKAFVIHPNFQEQKLEMNLQIKGRIRLGTLGWIAFRLWKNKDVKALLDNYKKLQANTKNLQDENQKKDEQDKTKEKTSP